MGDEQGFEERIDDLNEDKWISVKDRLPDWYEWVHVWSNHFESPIMTRRVETGDGKDGWNWDWSRIVGLCDMGVTYWMPLPEPPQEE